MPSAEDWQSASTKIVQLLFKKKRQDEYDALCRAAFEKSADAILVLSKTEIVGCNEAAIRLLRCNSKADILSRQPSDLAPETQPDGRRSADVASEQIAIAAKEGHARFEWMHRRLDGSTFPVRITLVPVQVNGRSLILSYRQDISELVTAREDKKLAMARLANDFEVKVGAIVDVVASAATEMATTAASLTATADQTSRQVTAFAAASEQASANVQSVASATEELASSVAEISRQVAASSAVAAKAVSKSKRTNALVGGLTDAGKKINAVTSMIHEIASQTNLLPYET